MGFDTVPLEEATLYLFIFTVSPQTQYSSEAIQGGNLDWHMYIEDFMLQVSHCPLFCAFYWVIINNVASADWVEDWGTLANGKDV